MVTIVDDVHGVGVVAFEDFDDFIRVILRLTIYVYVVNNSLYSLV